MEKKFSLLSYDYSVPGELIAQEPLAERDQSRLLVLERATGNITHDYFYNLGSYLKGGDCLVMNDTKVLPARLFGKTARTGANIEILVLSRVQGMTWEVMIRNSRRLRNKDMAVFPGGISMEVVEKKGKTALVAFNMDEADLRKMLWKSGTVPLPPYIKKGASDEKHRERYQTVYAEKEGAKAAPTAGLHFTRQLLGRLAVQGVKMARVTLHVGLGTFEAVAEDDIRGHRMHEEEFEVDKNNASLINSAEGRIIAVGTTSMRALESAVSGGKIEAMSKKTGIYIYPGYEFKAADGLITNFHLPKTTLLALVYAFGGMEFVKKAYAEAIKRKYRLFSYGDAMLII